MRVACVYSKVSVAHCTFDVFGSPVFLLRPFAWCLATLRFRIHSYVLFRIFCCRTVFICIQSVLVAIFDRFTMDTVIGDWFPLKTVVADRLTKVKKKISQMICMEYFIKWM